MTNLSEKTYWEKRLNVGNDNLAIRLICQNVRKEYLDNLLNINFNRALLAMMSKQVQGHWLQLGQGYWGH